MYSEYEHLHHSPDFLSGRVLSATDHQCAAGARGVFPSAPADLIAGLGKDDKKIYVVPSRDLVVVRLGDEGVSSAWAISGYDDEIWTRIMAVID